VFLATRFAGEIGWVAVTAPETRTTTAFRRVFSLRRAVTRDGSGNPHRAWISAEFGNAMTAAGVHSVWRRSKIELSGLVRDFSGAREAGWFCETGAVRNSAW